MAYDDGPAISTLARLYSPLSVYYGLATGEVVPRAASLSAFHAPLYRMWRVYDGVFGCMYFHSSSFLLN